MSIRDKVKFKKIKIKKSEFTNTIISVMESAGWENISSMPSRDASVMYSKGEDGRQDIYVQIHDAYIPTASASYLMASTNVRYGGVRLLSEYVPGASGTAGTLTPASDSMMYYVPFARSIKGESSVNLYYNVNMDRIVFVVEDLYSKEVMWYYFGKPRPSYSKAYSNQNIVATGHSMRYIGSTVIMGLADTTHKTQISGALLVNDMGASRNVKGEVMASEIGIAHADTGFIGYVDGLYAIPKDFITGSSAGSKGIMCGDRKLNAFKCAAPYTGTSWYNSTVQVPIIAFEIEEEEE